MISASCGYDTAGGGRAGRYTPKLEGRIREGYEKEGQLGTMLFFVNEAHWTNQRCELVRVGNRTTLYT